MSGRAPGTGSSRGETGTMRIGELIAGLDVRHAPAGGPGSAAASAGANEIRICDITEDSRTVMPGSLFVARRGEQADGREFVPAALRAGAAAILTDDPAFVLRAESKAHGASAAPALLVTPDIARTSAFLAERFY